VLLLDQMAGLPKELHDFRMFEEVPTMVGDDGEDVGCSGYFGTVLMPVAGRLIRTVSSDRWCRGLTFGVGFSDGNPTYGEEQFNIVYVPL
jgi:hypothetical protein